jgi:MFS family permease
MKSKIITRNILLLSLVSFFTDMSSEMLYPVMPLFFASIGISAVAMGVIEGCAEAVAGVSKSFFGHLGDRLGRPEWFVRIGYSLSAISKPMLGLGGGAVAFIAIRSADRFGKGIRTAPRDAILSMESDKKARGRVFGFHRSLDTLGAAVGPLIALALIAIFSLYNDLSKIFIFAIIPGIAAVILTFMVRSSMRKPVISWQELRSACRSYTGIFRPSLYPPSYKKLLIGLILVGICNSSDIFLLLRASELVGSQQTVLGFTLQNAIVVIGLYIIFNLAYAALSLVTGASADKYGFRNTFIVGLAAFAVAYGMMGRSLGLGMLLVVFCIYALFAAVNDAVVKAWLSTYLPKDRMGSGLGVANTLISLSFLISSILTGLLWARFSSAVALSVLSFAMLVPMIYVIWALPAKEEA